MITIRTAHDVRKLRGCAHCDQIGMERNMVFGFPYENAYFHGRCFVAKFGFDALVDIQDRANGLMLGDLGVDLMRRLLDSKRAAS